MTVYVLSYGVLVEGLAIAGVFSSRLKAEERIAQLRRSISYPTDVEFHIQQWTLDSSAWSAPWRLIHPWTDWRH